jgi:hypothetical protein
MAANLWRENAVQCALAHAKLIASRAQIKARLVELGLSASAANSLLPKELLDPDSAEVPPRTEPLDDVAAALQGTEADDLAIPEMLRREP